MYQTGYYATGYYQTGYYTRSQAASYLQTYYALVMEARYMLGDDNEMWYRYPDSMLVNILNRGLHQLARLRPDAFYDLYAENDLNVPEVTELSPGVGQVEWTSPFVLDMRFYPALLAYITGMAEVSEDPYTNDGRAAMQLMLFKKQVMLV